MAGCADAGTVFPSKELLELHLQSHTGEVLLLLHNSDIKKILNSLARVAILVPVAPEFSQRRDDDPGMKPLTMETQSWRARTVGKRSPVGWFSICTPGGIRCEWSNKELKQNITNII